MTTVVQTLALGEDGPTVMVKDTIDVMGYPTMAGSRSLQDTLPAKCHADVVARLLNHGWRLTGKTNMHELAFGTTGLNRFTGTPVNPRFPDRIPGGSSSGSAVAVAAELCDAALGTDTGGSVRTPAACCGVFGLKPTFDRVSRQGVMPAFTTLDCVGPFARNMSTIVRVMAAICPDFDEKTASEESLSNITLGVTNVAASQGVMDTIRVALSGLNTSLKTVDIEGMEEAYTAGMHIINRETFNACKDLVATGLVGEDVAGRILAAGSTTDEQLQQAEQVRTDFSNHIDELLAETPILVMPTMPDFPILLTEAADTRALLGMTAFVRPFNLSGHPAITIPLISEEGLPVGLQLIAAKGADEFLCAIAADVAKRLNLE